MRHRTSQPSRKVSRTSATVLALAAGAGGLLPLVVSDNDQGQSPLFAAVAKVAGTDTKSARATLPDDPASATVAQSSALGALEVKADDTQVNTDVVEYFRQACVPLAAGAGITDRMSIVTEQAIGQTLDEKKTTHADGVAGLAHDLRTAAETLKNIPAPVNSALAAASYEANLKQITDKFVQVADTLDPFVQQLRDAESLQKLTELETEYKKQLGGSNAALSELLNNLVGAPGGVTAATSEAVRQLEGCQGLLKPSPLPADTFVVESAVDLHVRIQQASQMLDEGNAKITTLYADTEGKTFSEGKDATLAAWDARIEAANKAIEHVKGWHHPSDLPLDLENSLIGYDQLRDDAVHVFEVIRDTTQAHRDALAAATSPSALNAALTPASDALNSDSVAQMKLAVRADRIAPSPNTATTEAIKARLLR